MEQFSYWQKQSNAALFKNVDLERPEQRQLSGRLAIIGGNKSQFFTVANAAELTAKLGIGTVSTVLPDSLKSKLPPTPNLTFAPSESSGGFAKSAQNIFTATKNLADYILLVGDLGKNSETAITISELVKTCDKPLLITRDSVDLVASDAADWIEKPNLTLLLTLPQLQKLLRSIFYPKIITLSMPTNQLIETLHKLTLSYPSIFITYHNSQLIAASHGNVVTCELKDTKYNPISLWSGELAAKIATYQLWNPGLTFEAAVSAFLA